MLPYRNPGEDPVVQGSLRQTARIFQKLYKPDGYRPPANALPSARFTRGIIVLRRAIAGSVLLLCAQAATAATADEIRILMEQGKPADAYQQGKLSPERLGDP